MDHPGAGVGSQSEAFYDLLKPSNDSANFFHKGGDNPTPEFEFGHDDVLPGMNLHSNSASATAPSQTNKNMYASRGGDEPSSGGIRRPSSYETQVYQTHDHPVAYEYLSQRQDPESASANTTTIAAVDVVMKKYADSILLLLRNISDRTSQLESTTQRLEYSLQGLKATVAESFGDTNAKMEVLENLIREVQTGVQVLQGKQEIIEAHFELGNLQLNAPGKFSSTLPATEGPPKVVTQANQPELVMNQPLSAPFHQQQMPSPATILQQHPPSLPSPTSYQQPQLPLPPQLPPGHQQQLQQHVPLPSAPQQHQLSPQHQPQLQHVQQGPPLPHYNQQPDAPPYSSFQHGQNFPGAQQPPQYPTSFSSESPPYMPSKYEPLPDRQSPTPYPPSLQPHGPPGVQRYEPFPGKASAMPPSYPPSAHPVPAAPAYENQPSITSGGYGNLGYRVAQPPPAPSGGGGYPRLPTAQPVHTISNPVSAAGTPPGNRSSVDEVIENAAAMGFPRDQIRAVVRRLTENGQSVDLNVVIDKVVNGGANQPQKAWYGR